MIRTPSGFLFQLSFSNPSPFRRPFKTLDVAPSSHHQLAVCLLFFSRLPPILSLFCATRAQLFFRISKFRATSRVSNPCFFSAALSDAVETPSFTIFVKYRLITCFLLVFAEQIAGPMDFFFFLCDPFICRLLSLGYMEIYFL